MTQLAGGYMDGMLQYQVSLVEKYKGDHITKGHGVRTDGDVQFCQLCAIQLETGIKIGDGQRHQYFRKAADQELSNGPVQAGRVSGIPFAHHHICILFKGKAQELFNILRVVLAISVHRDEEGGCCVANPCLQCTAIPPVHLVMEHADTGGRLKVFQNLFCVVARSIVNKDKFPVPGPAKLDQDRGEGRQILRLVINWDDNCKKLSAGA